MTDTDNLAKIDNQSSRSIVVVDTYSQKDAQGQEQQISKILPDQDTNQEQIGAGKQGHVLLNDTYIPDATPSNPHPTAQPSLIYRLLLSSAASLYPFKAQSELQSFTTGKYPDVTLTDDDVKVMTDTSQFYQSISAYPNSDLAKNFAAALQGSYNSASSGESIDSSVNQFFQSTNDYQDVTLSSYDALTNYYNSYPNVWANYQDSMSYYIYESNAKSGSQDSIGTLKMVKVSTGVPDVNDHNGGYNIQYTDSKGKVTKMYYSNGQFVSDINSDLPALALSGTFTVKNMLTGISSDNQIIPVLIGTMNGISVMGFDEKNSESIWDQIKEDIGVVVDNFMKIVQPIIMIFMLVQAISFFKSKLTRKKDPTEDEVNDAKKDSTEQSDEELDDTVSKMSGGEEEPADSIADAQDIASDSLSVQLGYAQKEALENLVELQELRIQQIVEVSPYGPTEGIEESAEQLKQVQQELDSATPDNINDVVAQQSAAMDSINTQINQEQDQIYNDISAEQRQQLDQSKEESEEFDEDMDEMQKSADETRDGENDGKDDDFIDDFDLI